MCLTRCEVVLVEAKPPGNLPLHALHLRPVFELVHLQQRRAVLLHPLHVTTATFEETHQLVVHQVAVLHVCRGRVVLL